MTMNLPKKVEEATEVIAHDVTPLTVNTDASAYARMGWIIVLFGVGGFLLWALMAPLDRGVPLQGTLAKESNRKLVQSLAGGTVDQILVKDGDVVKAGQVLVRMNGVVAGSQAELARGQYVSVRTAEARLLAERDGKNEMTFPSSLAAMKNDARAMAAYGLQQQLFSSRQAALRNDLSATDASIAGLKGQIEGVKESREGAKAQLLILKEQLDSMRDLAKDGYVARSRMLEVERSYIQVNSAIAEATGNLIRNQSQVSELNMRRAQRQQEYQREVRASLADVQKEAEALAARLKQLDYELASVDIKAPADGVVTDLAVFTSGGVVQSGYKMMEIVPSKDGLVVEGQVPVNLIDKVRPGLKVELTFSAFNSNKTPHIPGEVIQVAADRTHDERSGMPYYKMRVRVTEEGAKMIAAKKLDVQPGMPVDLFVKTGERTMMNYLLKPLFDRAHSALTEE
jgi:protease secretion system membrane fusion protein